MPFSDVNATESLGGEDDKHHPPEAAESEGPWGLQTLSEPEDRKHGLWPAEHESGPYSQGTSWGCWEGHIPSVLTVHRACEASLCVSISYGIHGVLIEQLAPSRLLLSEQEGKLLSQSSGRR